MAKALETESREALIWGLSDVAGEESFAGLVWHKIFEHAGKKYVLAMNAGHAEKRIRIHVEAEWMAMLYGESATFADGVLEITLLPQSMSFLKETDGTLPGLYQGHLQVTNIKEGSYTLRNATYAAVYSVESGMRELVQFCTADESIRIRGEGKKEVQIFLWDEMLSPFI